MDFCPFILGRYLESLVIQDTICGSPSWNRAPKQRSVTRWRWCPSCFGWWMWFYRVYRWDIFWDFTRCDFSMFFFPCFFGYFREAGWFACWEILPFLYGNFRDASKNWTCPVARIWVAIPILELRTSVSIVSETSLLVKTGINFKKRRCQLRRVFQNKHKWNLSFTPAFNVLDAVIRIQKGGFIGC